MGAARLPPASPRLTPMAIPPGHTSFVIASGVGKGPHSGRRHGRLYPPVCDQSGLACRRRHGRPAGGQFAPRKLYDMLAAERMMISGYHFPFPSLGHIEKAGNAYRLIPAGWNPVL